MGIIRVSMRTGIRIVCLWALVWRVLVVRELARAELRLEDVGVLEGVEPGVDV